MKIGDVFFEKHTIVKMSSRDPEQWAEADVEEVDAIEIPDNATNGDMIKALFPDSELHKEPDYISLTIKKGVEIVAYIEDRGASWWFAPYKENKE